MRPLVFTFLCCCALSPPASGLPPEPVGTNQDSAARHLIGRWQSRVLHPPGGLDGISLEFRPDGGYVVRRDGKFWSAGFWHVVGHRLTLRAGGADPRAVHYLIEAASQSRVILIPKSVGEVAWLLLRE